VAVLAVWVLGEDYSLLNSHTAVLGSLPVAAVLGEDAAAAAARGVVQAEDSLLEKNSCLGIDMAVLAVVHLVVAVAFVNWDFFLAHLDADFVQSAMEYLVTVLQVEHAVLKDDLPHFDAAVASAVVVERFAVPIRPVFAVAAAFVAAFVVPNAAFWLVAVPGLRPSTSHRTNANRAKRFGLGDEADSYW